MLNNSGCWGGFPAATALPFDANDPLLWTANAWGVYGEEGEHLTSPTQKPGGWRSAAQFKSVEKRANFWTLCCSSRCFREHGTHSLTRRGRLPQLQCCGHEAHYPNFLHNVLTPGQSVRVSQLKAASQDHISLQSSSPGGKKK